MNEATKQFFAKFYLHKASSNDYVDWAISCLEQGFDSKNLCMLAAEEKPYFPTKIEERFRRAITELGWSYPDRKQALISYAQFLAKEIISGQIAPEDGCGQIYWVSFELDYPEELKGWLWLEEGHDPVSMEWLWDDYGYSQTNKGRWIEVIIREAKKLAEAKFT